MQLIDNTAKTATKGNSKIEIKIPCCWNCMANNCGAEGWTHTNNHELSDFF